MSNVWYDANETYEVWQNQLDEMFWFSLDNVEYWVPARGIVKIPVRFRDIPAHRGLALRLLPQGWPEDLPPVYVEPELQLVEVATTEQTDKPKPKGTKSASQKRKK